MIPKLIIGQAVIYAGNNLDILPELQSNSVDSIVCDPPYELGFMGKTWDNSGIAYSVELWQQCLRVLKPGGHLLAFGGTRTWHRLAVAIEDAGFEIRDSIAWVYGSGFPKSHNIEKATGDPAYAGWGTALKPAHEPIVVARKPLIGTVAQNVLKYGVGGLNIDGTRIGYQSETDRASATPQGKVAQHIWFDGENKKPPRNDTTQGRFPANLILDEYTAELLDEQSGFSKSGKAGTRTSDGFNANAYGSGIGIKAGQANGEFGDFGGASRFFYVAKASKRDRNEGLEDLPVQEVAFGGHGNNEPDGMTQQLVHAPRQNFHPTVKPTTLMQYLIRLVTPQGGTVLDPFTGSGSTGKATILEGNKFIGIELTEEYLPIIEGRLKHAYLTLDDKEADLFE
jgi:site-specific DNA-methyltransferase (adenine-specific)